jgi:hypothetical protein
MDAHIESIVGGSQRLYSSNSRATFLPQATNTLKRLQNPLSQLRPDQPAISARGTNRPYLLPFHSTPPRDMGPRPAK